MKNDITFKELKKSGYTDKTISQEIQANLIAKIKAKEPVFEGLWGYEDTVVPQLKKAILAGHHINLLGLRGQAKTRIARSMVNLLDEYMPIVKGSEINDSPFQPISKFARDMISELGDDTPISWVHRSERFFEKLATPDVNVADLIGDIDPIKAATLKLPYTTQASDHFHMIFKKENDNYMDLPGLSVLLGGLWIANLNYWGCNQYITQRALGADLPTARKGLLFAAFLKLLMPVIVVLPGIAAFLLYEKGMFP